MRVLKDWDELDPEDIDQRRRSCFGISASRWLKIQGERVYKYTNPRTGYVHYTIRADSGRRNKWYVKLQHCKDIPKVKVVESVSD